MNKQQAAEALAALDWLIISLDMSHEQWCDSAAWRDDFKEKSEFIKSALQSVIEAGDPDILSINNGETP